MEIWEQEFLNPGREYRSQPFWAWDGELSEEEIRWQIREMARQGVGGFFMHSREGLETPYMGEKWLSCIRAAVEEAGKHGMKAWLYDEDRWPSGTAGGQVTAQGDAYRLKGLTLEVCKGERAVEVWRQASAGQVPADASAEKSDPIEQKLSVASGRGTEEESLDEETLDLSEAGEELPGDGLLLALYAAHVEGMVIHSYRRLALGEGPRPPVCAQEGGTSLYALPLKEGEVLLVARLECSAGSEWFNDQAPPDNLHPGTVASFLEKTHEIYYRTVGKAFGNVIPGCFTDEPSLADRHAAFPPDRSWIPWTYGFIRYYREKRGRSVLDTLPCVYFNGLESTKARYDYWHTVSDRYLEAYSKTISQWCQEHGIAFTGHFLQEDKLGLCARVNGSVMPHYKYQGVPGIDMLREETREYITVKQCTSVAHQFGKREVLTETYGCTGWDFTFEGMKWIGDWQYVLGVNTRCPHLALYSLKGLRKRDYPPSFHYNTSWWEKNHVTEDYFARLGVALKQGKPVRKLLVLHPMGTAWGRLGVSPYGNPVRRLERDIPAINQYGNEFNEFLEELSRQHMDYDLGDETLIESDGSVQDARFCIGEAAYEAVLVPVGDTWRRQTVALLQTFADQGGRIFWMDPVAMLVDGEKDTDGSLARLASHGQSMHARCVGEMVELLAAHGMRTLEITDGQGRQERAVLSLLKMTGEKDILFLVNQDRERPHEVRVCIPGRNAGSLCRDVEEWDPCDGSRWKVEWEETSQGVSFGRTLGACESGLFVCQWEEQGKPGRAEDLEQGILMPGVMQPGELQPGILQQRVMQPGELQPGILQQRVMQPGELQPEGSSQKITGSEVLKPGALQSEEQKPVWGFKRCRPMLRKRLAVCPDTVPVRLTHPNVYVLDKCCYTLADMPDSAAWQEETEIWQVQRQIRELLGMRANEGGEQIQRYGWVHSEEAQRGHRLRLKMTVDVEVIPQGPVWLAAEDAGEMDLYVNGIRQEDTTQGWYLDKSFEKRPVCGLRQGKNEILLEMIYREKSELEACYLLGDFSVYRDAVHGRVVRGPVRELSCGDWTLQGLLHYCGSVVYQYGLPGPGEPGPLQSGPGASGLVQPGPSQSGPGETGPMQPVLDKDGTSGYMLRLGKFSAVCAAVCFNGEEIDVPWKARGDVWIPAAWMQQENKLEIELFSSPRNMLGPLHLAGGRPWTTNAGCFMAAGGNYTENYQTVPYGLMEAVELWEAE